MPSRVRYIPSSSFARGVRLPGVVSVKSQSVLLIPIGDVATETESSGTVQPQKIYAVGTAVETDSASAVTALKRRTLSAATETDTATAVTAKKSYAVSQALETDSSVAIKARKIYAVGTALESDSALTIRSPRIGAALETDSAQTLTPKKSKTITASVESSSPRRNLTSNGDFENGTTSGWVIGTDFGPVQPDTFNVVGDWSAHGSKAGHAVITGADNYTDFVSPGEQLAGAPVGGATHGAARAHVKVTDSSLGASYVAIFLYEWDVSGALINYTFSPQPGWFTEASDDGLDVTLVVPRQTFAPGAAYVGLVLEATVPTGNTLEFRLDAAELYLGDASLTLPATFGGTEPVTAKKTYAIGAATEAETASAITVRKTRALTTALETDTARAIGLKKPIFAASETDAAQTITTRKTRVLGTASETDTAKAVTRPITAGAALETDAAPSIGKRKTYVIGAALETDTALSIAHPGGRAVAAALETDTAQAFGKRKSSQIATSAETELAVGFTVKKFKAVVTASETDAAQGVLVLKKLTIGQAIEASNAIAFKALKKYSIGFPVETDSALTVALTGGAPIITVFGHEAGSKGPAVRVTSNPSGNAGSKPKVTV